MGHAPENTLPSMQMGLQLGADFLEFDIHLTKDGQPVAIHDETLDRTTNGAGLVEDHSLKEVSCLDAGSWFNKKFSRTPIPTLDELLVYISSNHTKHENPARAIVELKTPHYERNKSLLAQAVADKLKIHNMVNRVIVISFDPALICQLKTMNAEIACGFLTSKELPDAVDLVGKLKVEAFFPRKNLVTKDMVDTMRGNGILVATWTVNETEEYARVIECGVCAIGTNYPDRLYEFIHKRPKGNGV